MTTLTDQQLLARLVAFDSVSHKPARPIIDFCADYLASAGCRIWRQDYENGAKANLLAIKGSGNAGTGLLMAGHVDVVPVGEPDWLSDPFTLTERGGRLYGRGTTDMKGFDALAINLLARADEPAHRHPLAVLLTSDEEVGTVGAQHFARGWKGELPLPQDCLVGEPTEMKIVRMHKGHLRIRLRATGKPAHGAYPHLGVNAIEIMAAATCEIARLGIEFRELRTDVSRYMPEAPSPVLNIGLIRGGTATNVVAETCELDFGMRLMPGHTTETGVGWVRGALERLPAEMRGRIELTVVNDSPPMLCDESAPPNQVLMDVVGQRESIGVSYATDASALQAIGLRCVVFGPGSISVAHKANESIEIAEWQRGREVVERVIQKMCIE
ncbi:MAG: acetylornithine deacetylase [Phycisphaerae bacterium]